MSIDKKIEQTMIEEMLAAEKFRQLRQGEIETNIEISLEHLESVLSTGESRQLIQDLLVSKLTDEEKVIYLEFSQVQEKIFDLIPEFDAELSRMQAERVVEQSDYSEAKTKKQLH